MATMGYKEAAKKPDRRFSKKVMLATASIIIVLAVILSVLWLGGDEDDLYRLGQVQGGFVCEIQRDSSAWPSKWAKISDGNDSNLTSLGSEILGTERWAVANYGELPVGNLILSIYVIDIEGDGEMGRGDSIIVTAVNSTEFSSNVIYEFRLLVGSIAVSGVWYAMSFWFEGGRLVTGPMNTIVMPL